MRRFGRQEPVQAVEPMQAVEPGRRPRTAGRHGRGRGELGVAVTAIPSIIVRPGMTLAEAEAARRPLVVPVRGPEPVQVGDADPIPVATGRDLGRLPAAPFAEGLVPAAAPAVVAPLADAPLLPPASPPSWLSQDPETSLELLDWFSVQPVDDARVAVRLVRTLSGR